MTDGSAPGSSVEAVAPSPPPFEVVPHDFSDESGAVKALPILQGRVGKTEISMVPEAPFGNRRLPTGEGYELALITPGSDKDGNPADKWDVVRLADINGDAATLDAIARGLVEELGSGKSPEQIVRDIEDERNEQLAAAAKASDVIKAYRDALAARGTETDE